MNDERDKPNTEAPEDEQGGWDAPPEDDGHTGPYAYYFRRGQGDAVDPDVDDYYYEDWYNERSRR